MNLLKKYIQSFIKKSGNYVFIATITARVLSFLASWLALQLIDTKNLGEVLYAWNFITFILPFVGFGLHQSLIRFGALSAEKDKNSLLFYVIKNGVISSVLLAVLVTITSLLIPFEFNNTAIYIAAFSISFIPTFLLETIKVQFRLQHKNKLFSYLEIIYSITFCLLVFLLSSLYQEKGYIAALILAPTLITMVYFRKLHLKKPKTLTLNINKIAFWKYGVFGGLSNLTTMLLFAIDIILIGTILKQPEQVTIYRYVSIIPFSLLFLPRIFITTDFVSFTEKISSKAYIKNYIKSYMVLFSIISVLLITFFFFFGKIVLSLFHSSFTNYFDSFVILNIGICGILIFRGIFGNLLSSIGWIKANFYITLIALVINYFTNQELISNYGIKGAAITSAILMWGTGIISAIVFFIGYNKFLLSFKKTK